MELYSKVNFNLSIHDAVGRTESEMVMGSWVKVSQYFNITHVHARALGVTHGISQETPFGPSHKST